MSEAMTNDPNSTRPDGVESVAQLLRALALDCKLTDGWQDAAPTCDEAADALLRQQAQIAAMREALRPLARLKVPFKPNGNAGAYSLLFDDIERARQALGDEQ